MSETNASNFKKEHGDLAPDLVGVTELTSPIYFVPPSGTTAERPEDCETGTLRFNTDIGSLEVFRGNTIGWEQIQRREGQYLGGSNAAQAGSNKGTGTRAVSMGGNASPDSTSESISFITISTLGNSQDFGDLLAGVSANTACSSRTRALSMGGSLIPSRVDTIEFITFSSTGNGTDFGNMISSRAELGATSNNVRGIAGGGSPGDSDTMDYVTIAQAGDAIDFGNLTVGKEAKTVGVISNGTRGLFSGGGNPSVNVIDFITIMTTGDATDFGDLKDTETRRESCCSSTRGVIAGGNSPTSNKLIEFLTIATTGNTVTFGELTVGRINAGSASSPTRGVFVGGGNPPTNINTIDFIEIATTGDALDFGDLDTAGSTNGVCRAVGTISNGHGGL